MTKRRESRGVKNATSASSPVSIDGITPTDGQGRGKRAARGDRPAGQGTHVRASSRGAWLGLAMGDALGAPVEFQSPEAIATSVGRVTEMIAGGPWAAGEWTDDTALAIATAHAYAGGDFNVGLAAKAMVDWLDTNPKDVGTLTRIALGAISAGYADPEDAGAFALIEKPGSAGNGSLMRAAVTGLVRRNGDPRLIDESVALSSITHADPKCTAACATFNAVLSALVHDQAPTADALGAGLAVAQRLHPELGALVAGVVARKAPTYAAAPIGYVMLCLERALTALRDARSFEEGLVEVVNLGGDADTNGAVAGALLGARFGEEALPVRWLAAMRALEAVEKAYEIVTAVPLDDAVPAAPPPPTSEPASPSEAVSPPVGPSGTWEPDAYQSTAPLFPRTAGVRVTATAKVLSITAVAALQYRVAFRLGFAVSEESIVTGLLDAGAKTFEPEGALAQAFERYHEASDPTALVEKARYEWWACNLIDGWVRKALENDLLSPVATWVKGE
jgi:ADP-ribosyl-[dinitrogen reductase] hydrolase